MKKLLLLAAVALSAVAANAQAIQKAEMQKVKISKSVRAEQQYVMTENAVKGPQRLLVDDCFYGRPVGSLVHGFGLDNMGFYPCYLAVTPYKEFSLVNMCTNPMAAKWLWGEEDVTAEYADEYNNFVFSIDGASGYYMPTIEYNNATFTWGENNQYNTATKTYRGAMHAFYDIAPLRATDPHFTDPNAPNDLKGNDLVGWGFLSTHFLFGDGQTDDTDNETGEPVLYQAYACAQKFEKPMSPLYVENIFVALITLDKEIPLAADEELKLSIVDADGIELYALTCTSTDVILDDEPQSTDYGDLYAHKAVFSLKEVDELSGEMASVPFIIDQAFTAIITGFEGKGIGFSGHINTDEEVAEQTASLGEDQFRGRVYVYDVANPDDPDRGRTFRYQSPISIPLVFNALFDNAMVWETAVLTDGTKLEDFNVLKVSADGQTVQNVGYPKANFIQANTATSWFDETGDNEIYSLGDYEEEYPEWVYYNVDNAGWEDYDPETENPDPTVAIAFQCEPLEDGVEGRGVKLYIYGRGIKSVEPIYILQGNYTKEQCDNDELAAGVSSVTAAPVSNGKTYNMAGQQVGKSFKGFVIRDGKKFFQN